ncbi:MAG TPA: hypothetical protein VML96_02255 [Egibacteraceae bacterium]|nr:hypothetical protein [Egibacteraceae bacterium]
MNLGDILDGAFRLITANWRAVMLIAGVFLVPTQLLGAYLQKDIMGGVGFLDMLSDPLAIEQMEQQQAFMDLGPVIGPIILGLLTLLALPFIAGAISKVVAASHLGEQIGAGPALAAAGKRWWSLLGSWILVHLIEFGPLIVAIGIAVAGAVMGSAPLAILGVLLAVAAGLAILPIMALFVAVAPAIVVEGLGPIEGMRRSARLMRPRFWPVLGAAVVSGLLASVISAALSFVPQTMALLIGMHRAWPLVGVGAILANLVALPFVAGVATLLYIDGRVRSEGFDLELMAAELAGGS